MFPEVRSQESEDKKLAEHIILFFGIEIDFFNFDSDPDFDLD